MSALQRFMTFLGFSETSEDEDIFSGEPDGAETTTRRRGQLFSLPAQRQLEIVVLQPKTFDDARAAADYLKMRRSVVVNLRGTHSDLARRIVDFTSGVTYALDGHMLRVGEEIFLFTPSHVVITSDVGAEDNHTLFPLE
ncbi:MAG: cell division protein SepF [Bacillati bacterium ANGP1]|uniref:Cell division protein SepF n=1 Tax=Candidatus Segetimicrobium genomatis TaxID=2569760 RepID=A0A537L0N2_9BACT|nr:MAG: cell division protein SepF [Terrabacteria group bacterium ANGP1]